MTKKVLEYKLIKQPTKIGNITSKVVQVYKPKGYRITEDEIKGMVKELEKGAKKKKEKIKVAIYGLNGDRIRNLKAFDAPLKIQTYDEYHQGIDFESPNFIEFYQVNLVIHQYL